MRFQRIRTKNVLQNALVASYPITYLPDRIQKGQDTRCCFMGFGTSVIVAQIYWLNGQRDAVGSIPYNVSAVENVEKSGHSLPFYGFQPLRYLRQNSDLGRIAL